ncbi:MAG TPA: tetratricopeptide repeat protein [Gallionella sp.]|nr:tetratricopeptide repeat protein [Gallionella sp.]
MGILDRFRSAGKAAGDAGDKSGTPEQDAQRLIEEGHAHEAGGRMDEAMQCYLDAIRRAPKSARAHLNLGNALLAKGDLDGALDAFKTAIKLKPDYAEVHCALGVALKELGQLEDAVSSYKRAIALDPDLVEARSNLGQISNELFYTGNVLASQGQLENAVEIYHQALEINPDIAEVHCNLGLASQELGLLDEAVAHYRLALEIKPDLAEAHCNLGSAFHKLSEFENAVASYQRAVDIQPGFVEAHCNLGVALQKIGQFDGAIASYRRALELKPNYAEAYSNLGLALQSIGQLEGAVANYQRALEIKPDLHQARSELLYTLNFSASHTPSYYLGQAREFGRFVAKAAGTRFSSWQCKARPKRLRVGLVSGDLRIHPVGYFLEGLLPQIDPDRIELIAYPNHYKEDELTARIRPCFSAWEPVFGKSDEAAAHLIHDDGVHVLLDVSSHTGNNRLPMFAWKPAPVQATWLGLPSTSGLAEMDYVLGDPYAIPAEFDSHFSETVWRMPESCLCLAVPDSPVKVAPLPALTAGYVTFGSFNHLTKMTDEVVDVWARVLKSVPNSRLFLKTQQLGDPAVCEKTRQRFVSRGIAPERLLMSGTLASRDDHLATYNKVDIALDTFPYTGVTTSVEALWMGVPVLNMLGDRFITCTAGSIARNAGLPDWIAADQDNYVAKAVAFTSDLERLATMRAGLRQQVLASPLFDAPRFARNFEDALWGMWENYQAK